MKKCSTCEIEKPLSEFSKQKNNPDRLSYSCKECVNSRWRKWYVEKRDGMNQTRRANNLEIKIEVMAHYGKVCQCCGEDQIAFLSIDHIDGGGTQHRKSLGGLSGYNFYKWLKAQGYPEGYQVLCHNCNQAKGFFGVCPHKLTQKDSKAQ